MNDDQLANILLQELGTLNPEAVRKAIRNLKNELLAQSHKIETLERVISDELAREEVAYISSMIASNRYCVDEKAMIEQVRKIAKVRREMKR